VNWRQLKDSIFLDSATPQPTEPTEGLLSVLSVHPPGISKKITGPSVSSVSCLPGISENLTHQTSAVRERNRVDFPTTAALFDDLRQVFGDGVKVICGAENGHEVGTPEALAAMRADIAQARIDGPVVRVDCKCSACRRRKAKADETLPEPAEVRSVGVDRLGGW
jgi:hypothetical protein